MGEHFGRVSCCVGLPSAAIGRRVPGVGQPLEQMRGVCICLGKAKRWLGPLNVKQTRLAES